MQYDMTMEPYWRSELETYDRIFSAWSDGKKESEHKKMLKKKDWKDDIVGQKWFEIRELRSVVTSSIEEKRKEGMQYFWQAHQI